MDTINDSVNFNTATQEELQNISGIGAVLASNILKARPFSSLEDIQRVKGIGANLLERLKSKITVGDHEEIPPEVSPIIATNEEYPDQHIEIMGPELQASDEIEPTPEDIEDNQTIFPEDEEVTVEEHLDEQLDEMRPEPAPSSFVPPPGKPPQTRSVSPGRLFWTVAVFSLLAVLLSVSCSLGSLWIINGSIHYARTEQITNLKQQSTTLENQLKNQLDDINEIQTKLEQVEMFKDQILDIQNTTTKMQTDLLEAVEQVENLSQDIENLDTNLEILQIQSARFQRFMDGLRKLMNALEEP